MHREVNELMPRRRRNPEDELPYEQWIPAHAVMFGEDGSVSLMTEPRAGNPRPDLIELINTYNEATDPGAYRSDEEHEVERTRARAALSAIRQYYMYGVDYKELSNGALWPIQDDDQYPYTSRKSNPPTRFSDVKQALAAVGMTIRKTGMDDELEVNFADAQTDAAAYYTDDLADAYYTGLDMARRGRGARRANITMQGYTDEHGFHPVRWSPGYRQSMHGEKGKRYDLHPSTEFKKRERQRLKHARRR